MPDKTVVILEEEIDLIHRAIANEICGSPDTLQGGRSPQECDERHSQEVVLVQVIRTRRRRQVSAIGPYSDAGAFLSFARQEAIDRHLAEQIEQMRA